MAPAREGQKGNILSSHGKQVKTGKPWAAPRRARPCARRNGEARRAWLPLEARAAIVSRRNSGSRAGRLEPLSSIRRFLGALLPRLCTVSVMYQPLPFSTNELCEISSRVTLGTWALLKERR